MATASAIIQSQQNYANTKDSTLQAFIWNLLDAAYVNYDGIVEELFVNHTPLNVVADMLDNIAGQFPAVPAVIVPDFNVPAVPDISFTAITHDITTLEQARADLLSDLVDGGYGIDTDDESRLLDRTRDRAAAEANAATAEADRVFQSRRFPTPPGTLYGALERVQQGQAEAVQAANRDIYVQRAQQFVQARQFAIQTAGIADRTRADIKEIQFRIEEARARYLLALFESELTLYRTQIAAAIDKATLTVRVFEAQATVANARVQASSDAAKVFIAEYQANVQSFLGVIDARIKNARAQLDAQVSRDNLVLEASKAGAGFFSNVVSSALGAINTMVSQTSEDA